MWRYISPLYPKGAPSKVGAKPEPVSAREPDRIAPPRGPTRTEDVADTARYFLNHGITSRDVIAGLLAGWDRESVEAVIAVVERADAAKHPRPQPRGHDSEMRHRTLIGLYAAFVIDLLLAAVPMIDAIILRHGGGWTTYIIFWVVFAAFRISDRWAMRRQWSIWKRAALKVPIFFMGELIAMMSAAEFCGATLTSCRPVF